MGLQKKMSMRGLGGGMKGIPKATLRGAVKPVVKGGAAKVAATAMKKK